LKEVGSMNGIFGFLPANSSSMVIVWILGTLAG